MAVKVILKIEHIITTEECGECGHEADVRSTPVHGWTVETVTCSHCGHHEVRTEEAVRLPDYYTGEWDNPGFFLGEDSGMFMEMRGRKVG